MILETLGVELSPELREEQCKILSVDGTLDISFHSAGNGKFPVDVDSVKKSWVLADKEIDRRLRKQPPARIGERDVGESSGAGPATDRDGQLQVAVPRLQKCELVEVRARVGNAGFAVITDLPKRVENVREVSRGKLGDAGAFAADAPRCEITDHAWHAHAGRGGRSRRRGCTGTDYSGEAYRKPNRRAHASTVVTVAAPHPMSSTSGTP